MKQSIEKLREAIQEIERQVEALKVEKKKLLEERNILAAEYSLKLEKIDGRKQKLELKITELQDVRDGIKEDINKL